MMLEFERLLWAVLVLLAYAILCWCSLKPKRRPLESGSHRDSSLLVAYASQSGRATELAQATCEALAEPAQLLPLNEVDEAVLARVECALFIVSTYGEGEPPDNALRFARRYLTKPQLNLANLRYGLLALGDSRYPAFCAFGQRLAQSLCEQGAASLFEPIELDSAAVETDATASWYRHLQSSGLLGAFSELSLQAQQPWQECQLMNRRVLNLGSPGEPLYHLQFRPHIDTQLDWQAGDIVEVLPHNSDQHLLREYSIASVMATGHLDLIVRLQRHPDGALGLCSGWLGEALAIGESVRLRVRHNPLFSTPPSSQPLILIGNGSGYAGLRSHLLARQQMAEAGRNWLLFGERCPDADCIFDEELQGWLASGALDQLDRAFSRSSHNPAYVQDLLYRRAEKLRDWVAEGAVIMVCGSREGMAQAVDAQLRSILSDSTVDQLLDENRYQRDVY